MENSLGVITGAAKGLGRETALLCAAEGARVIVADRDVPGAEETVALIEAAGGSARAMAVDVLSEESVEGLFRAVAQEGPLRWAVNNAGILPDYRELVDLDMAGFDRIMGINARGVALCLKYEMGAMRDHGGGGRIVNIGSTRSFRAGVASAGYVASKFAVIGLTETAALEGGPMRVRVNAVCPGLMETPMVAERLVNRPTAMSDYLDRVGGVEGRIGRPEEVAEAVLWLLSDESSYVTGHSLVADGGYLIR